MPAQGTRRAVVVCLHAMMTDGRYFAARKPDGFAAALAADGIEVVVADFRGHGQSQPPVAGPDDWSFDDLVDFDLPAIVAATAEATGCAPRDLVLLGHSLGGLVVTAALGLGRIPAPRRVLLGSTNVWLGGTRRRALMAAYRGVTRLVGHAPIRALRIGTADVAATYVQQLTGWARSGRWTSLRGLDYGAVLAAITTPVVPFVGGGDWMCSVDDAAAFARQIPTAREVRVVGRADHFTVFADAGLRAWLAAAAL